MMRILSFVLAVAFAALSALCALSGPAAAQQKEIKIGFIYDLTGPFAGGGSEPAMLGAKAAVDLVNERGGVEGYRINAIFADAQSKVDVAINEMTRLYDQEKVALVMGVYSSAQCVPMAQQADQRKKFLWANVCVATSVLKDKKFTYVFRPTVHSDQYGAASCDYIAHYAQSKFGIAPKNMRIAIIHEDGPYGSDTGSADELHAKEAGIQILVNEAYSATTSDLSALVTKLKRAGADVILHTGYNPDITLFLRQAREAGLKFKMLIGHGAGYSQRDKLRETFGGDL
ncbi:MAG TPA: ABC transporter substrate-binding protein, partial [Burkholderiales bacterium]|nr:ABC transporter substrate-binding protein [Burkholderiales bacterium]